jgi:hypothetical protein
MQQITEISKTLGGLPVTALVALIILAAFGLSAYAISAVVKISKGGRRGNQSMGSPPVKVDR